MNATTYTPEQYTAVADAASSYRCIAFLLFVGLAVAGFLLLYKLRVMGARHSVVVREVDSITAFLVPMGFVVPVVSGSASGGTDEDTEVFDGEFVEVESDSGQQNNVDALASAFGGGPVTDVRDDTSDSETADAVVSANGGAGTSSLRFPAPLPFGDTWSVPNSFTLFISKRGALGDGWLL